MTLGFADDIFGLSNGNVEDLLGKLDGIARKLGREASMAQPAPRFHEVQIQTDPLPEPH